MPDPEEAELERIEGSRIDSRLLKKTWVANPLTTVHCSAVPTSVKKSTFRTVYSTLNPLPKTAPYPFRLD
jgi:hypothetical protein